MRGQALIATAAALILLTIVLLIAIPKKTLGPTISDNAVLKREVENALTWAWYDALTQYARSHTLGEDMEKIREWWPAIFKQELAEEIREILAQEIAKKIQGIFEQEIKKALNATGARCEVRQVKVQVKIEKFYRGEIVYTNKSYAEVSCEAGGEKFLAFFNLELKLGSPTLTPVGVFGGLHLPIQLTVNGRPTYIAKIYTLLTPTAGGNKLLPMELTGTEKQPVVVTGNGTIDLKLLIPAEVYYKIGIEKAHLTLLITPINSGGAALINITDVTHTPKVVQITYTAVFEIGFETYIQPFGFTTSAAIDFGTVAIDVERNTIETLPTNAETKQVGGEWQIVWKTPPTGEETEIKITKDGNSLNIIVSFKSPQRGLSNDLVENLKKSLIKIIAPLLQIPDYHISLKEKRMRVLSGGFGCVVGVGGGESGEFKVTVNLKEGTLECPGG